MANISKKNSEEEKKNLQSSKYKSKRLDIFLCTAILITICAAVISSAFIRYRFDYNELVSKGQSVSLQSSVTEVTETKTITSTTRASSKTTSTTTELSKTTNRTTVPSEPTVRFPIDINAVTYDELLEIDGIGDVTASKIIDYRNRTGIIYNMDLLLEIDGIGEKKLEMLKQYLYVSDENFNTITQVSTALPEVTIQTTTLPITTTPTTTTTTVKTTVTTAPKVMKKVNINTADAEEIADCLLISIELADKVVDLREKIHFYQNSLELLYIDGFTEKMHAERADYILV